MKLLSYGDALRGSSRAIVCCVRCAKSKPNSKHTSRSHMYVRAKHTTYTRITHRQQPAAASERCRMSHARGRFISPVAVADVELQVRAHKTEDRVICVAYRFESDEYLCVRDDGHTVHRLFLRGQWYVL